MKQEKGNSQGFNTAEVLLYIILPQARRKKALVFAPAKAA